MCCPAPYPTNPRNEVLQKPPRTVARHRGRGSRSLSRYTSSLCRIGRSSIFIDGGKGPSLLNGEERLPPYPATRQYRVGPRTAARIHDLRHSFATRVLEQCGTKRDKVARHFVALSTYLGHADIAHTYWYLEATPELMTDIAAAAEALVTEAAP